MGTTIQLYVPEKYIHKYTSEKERIQDALKQTLMENLEE